MKKIISALLLLFIAATGTAQENRIASLAIGREIPQTNVQMKSVTGKEVSLKDIKTDKGLLVIFSCNTCPFVIKAQARTREIIDYAKNKGIGIIIINSNEAQRDESDSYEAMQDYAKSQRYNVPYVVDARSVVADAFGATKTPEVFLFDGRGMLVYKGAMEDNPSNPSESKEFYLQAAISSMIAGQPVKPNSTKSVGCSIKRI